MALRAVNRAGRKAQSITLPAPVGGWNTRDALAAMPPGDAQAIVNLFPSATSVDLRKGYDLQRTIVYSTGPSVDVETAAGFVRYGETSLWAVGKVEGLNRSVLEDVVAGTEVTWADSLSGMTSYVQFANSGGNYVCAVFPNSGATDTYYTYDGTTWVAQGGSVSGSSSFRTIAAFQNRLWFTKGTTDLNAYYLATQAITGAPTAFQLGGYATKGGGLFGIGTWTLDGGVGGTDDLIVFVTTNGQAIVYQGTDPSSAASWRLVGVFDLSRPIGPPFKYGADLLVPCEDGLFSMAEVLRGNTGTEFAISDKVRTAWQAAAAGAAYSVSNVTSAYSPKFNMIVVNFPTSAFVVTGRQTSQWFVMNTITKAWTLFTGLDAWAVDVMAGDIYFANVTSGASGTLCVYKFGSDGNDDAAAITGYCRQAYTYLGTPGMMKCVTGLLPSWAQVGTYTVGFAVDSNFANAITTATASTNELSRASGNYRPLLSYPAVADAIAVFVEVQGTTTTAATDYCRWYNTTILSIPGGAV
jgi:hypothetical protein